MGEPAVAIESAAIEATPEATPSGEANVKAFAELLKQEHSENDDAPVIETPEPTEKKPAKADKEPVVTPEVAALRAAFKDGDVKKLAELLGEKESLKVNNSEWAKLRMRDREGKRELTELRSQIEAEKAKLTAERDQFLQANATIGKAAAALDRGDYISFLEMATGKPIKDIVDVLADDLTDPNKREMRSLRNQAERDRAEREREKDEYAKQQEQHEANQALARHTEAFRKELEVSDATSKFVKQYGDAFVKLVVEEQRKEWQRTGEELSCTECAQRVLKEQYAFYKRAKEVFEGFEDDEPSQKTPPGEKPAKKGSPGARLAPRKSVTQSQGGPTNTRELSAQERNAYFARLLKAEHTA